MTNTIEEKEKNKSYNSVQFFKNEL